MAFLQILRKLDDLIGAKDGNPGGRERYLSLLYTWPLFSLILNVVLQIPTAYGMVPSPHSYAAFSESSAPAIVETYDIGSHGTGPSPHGQGSGQILLRTIPVQDRGFELHIMRSLSDTGTVSVIFVPKNDPFTEVLSRSLGGNTQVVELDIDPQTAEAALAASPLGRKWLELKTQLAGLRSGFLLAGGVAGSYSVPFYFTSGINSSVAIFTAAFLTYSLQATFTQQWERFLDSGSSLADWVLSKMGRDLGYKTEPVRNAGRLGVVISYNIAYTSLIMTLGGVWDGALAAVILGMITMYDFAWDLALGGFVVRQKLSSEIFQKYIRLRMVIGAALMEPLAIAVGSGFQVVLGTIALGGVLTLFNPHRAELWAQKLLGRIDLNDVVTRWRAKRDLILLGRNDNAGDQRPGLRTFKQVLVWIGRSRTMQSTTKPSLCQAVFN